MKLFPYVTPTAETLKRLLKKYHRVVAVGPTGCGKTVIAALLLLMLGKRQRVLWIAHRFELLTQARDQLIAAGIPAEDVGILSGTEKTNTKARILVASVDIFQSGKHKIPRATLIVVDEAHHVNAESYMRIINKLPNAQVLGLTATPERLSGEPLGEVFAYMHIIAEAIELVALGYLVPAVVYGIPHDKARELVRHAGGGGGKDYSTRKLDRALRKRPLMAEIVSEWFRLAKGVSTIVYACTRKHGQAIAHRFRRAGVRTAYIDALTSDAEREDLLGPKGKLARGEVTVVVNVGVLTEGFDCPPVGCIVVARPTKSVTLWRQMCGRGARTVGKKKRYIVLDHAGNHWRHGAPDSVRDWSLDVRKKEAGPTPYKICPNVLADGHTCKCMCLIAAKLCPDCGYRFPLTQRELAERDAELERIRATEAELKHKAAVLRKLAAVSGLPESWVQRALREVA